MSSTSTADRLTDAMADLAAEIEAGNVYQWHTQRLYVEDRYGDRRIVPHQITYAMRQRHALSTEYLHESDAWRRVRLSPSGQEAYDRWLVEHDRR